MRILTMVWVLVLAACVETGGVSAQRGAVPPRVTVQSLVALTPAGGSQVFRVTLLIDNLGTEPLGVRELEFKLRLADQGILDGRSLVPFTVAALDQQTVTLDLSSDILSSLSRLLSFVQGPANTLSYEIYGKLTPDRRLKEPLLFSATGQVPLAMSSER